MYSFYLTDMESFAEGIRSHMTFGYYEPDFLERDLDWHPIKIHTQAGIDLDNLLIGGKDY